ncbi:unnamed protein product [Dibothriocephalus latus]|uniref:Secreted protein n=1 Tax=Dibothriocephalus latus TaxID=60516 RepID=A0A3P6RR37_DIBLA|nr:unnamed protein product [Dibothriocephalus latus]
MLLLQMLLLLLDAGCWTRRTSIFLLLSSSTVHPYHSSISLSSLVCVYICFSRSRTMPDRPPVN